MRTLGHDPGSGLPRAAVLLAAVSLAAGSSSPANGPDAAAQVGVVSHVKILSEHVEDVSSLEAWESSFLEGVTRDEVRGLMVWHSMVKFVLNGFPALEYRHPNEMVVDPIKIMNVYGYTFCGPHAASSIALARYAGLEARGWALEGHIVPEIRWDGEWHLLDSSLVTWFPREDGTPAGVEEIVGEVKAWLEEHPGLAGDPDRLLAFQRSGGWRGWKTGPALLARSPFLNKSGWYPARTHNWATTMLEFDVSGLSPDYEMAYSLGYRVNNQLRPGQRLTFNWSNQGLHVNMNEPRLRNDPSRRMGEGNARHTPAFGDLAPGRIGNGTLVWRVPLDEETLSSVALRAEGLRHAGPPGEEAVLTSARARPGVIELRVPTSYVYLTGGLSLETLGGEGSSVTVFFSRNHGRDWRPLGRLDTAGPHRIDISGEVFRLDDYRLRLVLEGEGAGLKGLTITHDFQHSQRALPALARGRNTIRFSAGPQEGTIALEGSLDPGQSARQITWDEYGPRVEGFERGSRWTLEGSAGSILVPVRTPGDMARIRLALSSRLRSDGDALDAHVSWDGGATFAPLGHCGGPHLSFTCAFTSPPAPPGTRDAVVRIRGHRVNVTRINILRIDADYVEPRGGFRPVKITYSWEESGEPRSQTHVARSPEEEYAITVGSDPLMKSLVLELGRDGS